MVVIDLPTRVAAFFKRAVVPDDMQDRARRVVPKSAGNDLERLSAELIVNRKVAWQPIKELRSKLFCVFCRQHERKGWVDHLPPRSIAITAPAK